MLQCWSATLFTFLHTGQCDTNPYIIKHFITVWSSPRYVRISTQLYKSLLFFHWQLEFSRWPTWCIPQSPHTTSWASSLWYEERAVQRTYRMSLSSHHCTDYASNILSLIQTPFWIREHYVVGSLLHCILWVSSCLGDDYTWPGYIWFLCTPLPRRYT